jgi:hypothetical protein
MLTITALISKVREIAASNPLFVYTRNDSASSVCLYRPTDDNPQGCIMGAAMRALGYDKLPEGWPIDLVLRDFYPDIYDSALEGEISWLNDCQSAQDRGICWGEAVTHADTKAKRRKELLTTN